MIRTCVIILLLAFVSGEAAAQESILPDTASITLLFGGRAPSTLTRAEYLSDPVFTTSKGELRVVRYTLVYNCRRCHNVEPIPVEGNRLPAKLLKPSNPYFPMWFRIHQIVLEQNGRQTIYAEAGPWGIEKK